MMSKLVAPMARIVKQARLEKRGIGNSLVDICSLNGSGIPQLRRAHGHCRMGRFSGPGSDKLNVPVAALLGQETHAQGNDWVGLKANLWKDGWKTMGAPAVSAHSCGASLSVRKSYDTGLTQGAKEDCSPRESPGRLASTWVDGIVRDGLLILSVYLWHGEGFTDRNRALLYAAGVVIKRHGGPWVLGGDFQNPPEDLHYEMWDWLKSVGGEVCAPGNVTCKSAHGGRTIDYFIIDSRISHGVRGIWTQMDLPIISSLLGSAPYRSDGDENDDNQKYVAPKSFEPRPATGCARQTVDEVSCLTTVGTIWSKAM